MLQGGPCKRTSFVVLARMRHVSPGCPSLLAGLSCSCSHQPPTYRRACDRVAHALCPAAPRLWHHTANTHACPLSLCAVGTRAAHTSTAPLSGCCSLLWSLMPSSSPPQPAVQQQTGLASTPHTPSRSTACSKEGGQRWAASLRLAGRARSRRWRRPSGARGRCWWLLRASSRSFRRHAQLECYCRTRLLGQAGIALFLGGCLHAAGAAAPVLHPAALPRPAPTRCPAVPGDCRQRCAQDGRRSVARAVCGGGVAGSAVPGPHAVGQAAGEGGCMVPRACRA